MKHKTKNKNEASGRREFIKKSGIALVGGTMAYPSGLLASTTSPMAAQIKVGLVGCGGRGTGAAAQALLADPNVVLTAMGDIFEDRLEGSYTELQKIKPQQLRVDKTHRYIGFDAYQKVIDSGVDVVILTTPPAFRPDQLAAAVDANKHVFCEKPMAVDAPGVRKVLDAAKKAKEKELSVVAGFTYRFGFGNREFFDRISKGAVGNVGAVTTFRFGGELWYKDRQPDWTEMTYQMRNWYYYNWLSGDFIVEQSVHSLDMMSWAMGDIMPTSAIGTGGRQVRTDDKYGNIFDHFAVEFDYASGTKGYHFTRQQSGTATRNTVDIIGDQGTAMIQPGRKYQIKGTENWSYDGEENDMYQTQHDELFAAIKNGKTINNGQQMANSSLLAIWARMAGYSGQRISYDEVFNSEITLGPKFDDYAWDFVYPMPPIAVPGKIKVV